ncbi:MAG: DUF1987 domain-containing protein [Bacteroidota bacterium]
MKALRLDKRKDTPKIDFNPDTNIFWIEGKCHPENITIFFEPVLQWINDYFFEIKDRKDVNMVFNLKYDYINSSSYKYQIELIRSLSKFLLNGIAIEIVWHYEKEDDDMRDSGIELFEMCEIKVPHRFQVYKAE